MKTSQSSAQLSSASRGIVREEVIKEQGLHAWMKRSAVYKSKKKYDRKRDRRIVFD